VIAEGGSMHQHTQPMKKDKDAKYNLQNLLGLSAMSCGEK
jgi:ribosomal protein S15P/S13E